MRIVPTKLVVGLARVSHRYGDVPALERVSLEMAAGEHVALLGPNGSGKTTLLSLVAGILRPCEGTVTRSADVAFVVQRSALPERLPITVRDTVAMGRWPARGLWRPLHKSDHHVIDACLDRMGLHGLADRRLAELSGGQRQRTLLAQALAQQAPALVLDEPEAGLDLESRATITAVLAEEAARGTCVIVATHDSRTACAARRCILLDSGHIVADGVPRDVLTGDNYADVFLQPVAR